MRGPRSFGDMRLELETKVSGLSQPVNSIGKFRTEFRVGNSADKGVDG